MTPSYTSYLRSISTILLLLILPHFVLAQDTVESAKHYIKLSKKAVNADSMIYYAEKALPFIDTINNTPQYITQLRLKALGFARKGDFENALLYFKTAYYKGKDTKDYENMALAADRVGTCYYSIKSFGIARKWYDTSIRNHRFINDTINICEPYLGIGNIFNVTTQLDSAIAYYELALAASTKGQGLKSITATSLSNLSTLHYQYSKDYEKCLEYTKKVYPYLGNDVSRKITNLNIQVAALIKLGRYTDALPICEEAIRLNDNLAKNSLYFSLSNMATIQKKLGDYPAAISFSKKAGALVDRTSSEYGKTIASIGDIFQEQNMLDSALMYMHQAEQTFLSNQDVQAKEVLLTSLSDVYSKKSDFEIAYNYLKNAYIIKDTILTLDRTKLLQDAYAKYETQLQKDSTALARYDTELARSEASRERGWKYLYMLLAGISLIGLFFIYREYQRYRKEQRIVEQENERLNEENQTLTKGLEDLGSLVQSIEFLDKTPIIINGQKVLLSDILYLEARDKMVVVHADKKRLTHNGNLKGFLEKLPSALFVQTHKSYIVNLTHIKSKFSQYLIMLNNDEVRVGRKYKNDFSTKYEAYTNTLDPSAM